MFHVMVYNHGLRIYSYPCALHIFSRLFITPEEAFRMAEEILKHYRCGDLAYVGYEELPLSTSVTSYVAVEFSVADDIEDVNIVSTVPVELAKAIEDYRKKWLTLDYDCKTMTCKAKLINALKYIKNYKIYETYRGYHVRALLPKTMTPEEIIELRRKLGDDEMRIIIDKIYINRNMAFLTNMLFNKKCWFEDKGMKCSTETETSLDKIFAEYMKERLITAYEKISQSLAEIVKKSDVKVVGDTVVIRTAEAVEAGKLIGRQGINVRAVENELGVKVRIAAQSENADIKRKLYDLKKKFV